jgi:hypothetical protein
MMWTQIGLQRPADKCDVDPAVADLTQLAVPNFHDFRHDRRLRSQVCRASHWLRKGTRAAGV